MATIPIDFEGVEAFDNLPLAKYFGQIDKIELRPANDPTKHDQLQVQYLVVDGELVGRRSSEFLSLSPKAAFRLKRWFNHFGLADDMTGLEVDDETNLLIDPDLIGVDVIFEVYQDPKLYQGEVQVRTRLTQVLEEAEAVAAPAPVKAKPAAAAPARRAAAPAPTKLANQVDDVTDEADGVEDEPEEAPPVAAAAAPRRFAGRPAAAPAAGPARRTLR